MRDCEDVASYCDEAKSNGFEVLFMLVANNWFKFGAIAHNEHSSVDPDRKTFSIG